jgi:rSAM/selenodomain-associated transferase 1
MKPSSGRCLVLFAKEPVAGRVKTRLAGTIGAEAAARLYEAFLEDLAAGLGGEWERLLACDGDGGPRLKRIFRQGWTLQPQGEGTLGERMARAVVRAFAGDASKVTIAGSDAPTLTAGDIASAFAALEEADVVLAPSPDGGYSLAGLRRPVAASKVFGTDIRWSTKYALADTRRAAESVGYVVRFLEPVPDVDVSEDLAALTDLLRLRPDLAPFSRKALLGSL